LVPKNGLLFIDPRVPLFVVEFVATGASRSNAVPQLSTTELQ
jgi:hypothetical protein